MNVANKLNCFIAMMIDLPAGKRSIEDLINTLYKDYRTHNHKKDGSFITPYDYVCDIMKQHPNLTKYITYAGVCKVLEKLSKSTDMIVDNTGSMTHYFRIVLAINDILLNGVKLKFKEGDIIYGKPETEFSALIVTAVNDLGYTVDRIDGYGPHHFDAAFIDQNYKKVGTISK